MSKNTKLAIGSTCTLAAWGGWLQVSGVHNWPLTWVLGSAAVAFLIFTVFVWARPAEHPADRLARFIAEGRQLQARCKAEGQEPVIPAVNKWVADVERFLAAHVGQSYVVLFSDFSGLTQHVDPRKQSQAEISINYRIMRLTRFIESLQTTKS
jgi:hypothetical protein